MGKEPYGPEKAPEGGSPPPGHEVWLFIKRFWWILLAMIIAVMFFSTPSSGTREIPISQVITMAAKGELESIEVDGNKLDVITTNGRRFKSEKEPSASMVEILQGAGVDPLTSRVQITVKDSGNLFGALISFLPLILISAVVFYMMRRTQGNAQNIFRIGKSKARMHMGHEGTTFDDVAGVDEAKEELKEIVEFLRFPEKFLALGAKIPKGVLLIGPPGTGKTLLSRAVAGEAGVPFFSISASEFVEMFVGVGASRVRDLFDRAKNNAPCIVFIDEIDAVGRHRGAGLGGGHDEREQTLNQILVEMDGFDEHTGVIVLAATNRPDILDPALLRPGRFDRKVTLDNPDVRGRTEILKVHAKGKPLAEGVDLENVARQTAGLSGADLANLINEAAILAARRSKKVIGQGEFTESIDRVVAGPERKSRVISDREKEITAYHEAGHALVAHLLPHADPPYKVTIVSRGQSGGHTRYLPEEDRNLWGKNQFEAMIAAALAGRAAEEVFFDDPADVTTGASQDMERATAIARAMVTQYGMSEKLGPRTFGKREGMVFLGREIHEQRDYSESVAETIDKEVHEIIGAAHANAERLLTEAKEDLVRLAEHLIEHETVEGDALTALLPNRE